MPANTLSMASEFVAGFGERPAYDEEQDSGGEIEQVEHV